MVATSRQRIVILMLPILLALILMGHALAVQADFEACFADNDMNGIQSFPGLWSMHFNELAKAIIEQFSVGQTVFAGLGLIALSPFVVAWLLTKDRHLRLFWFTSSLVAFTIITVSLIVTGLDAYHDCDRKGVSLGILLMPIVYTAVNAAWVCGISVLRGLTR